MRTLLVVGVAVLITVGVSTEFVVSSQRKASDRELNATISEMCRTMNEQRAAFDTRHNDALLTINRLEAEIQQLAEVHHGCAVGRSVGDHESSTVRSVSAEESTAADSVVPGLISYNDLTDFERRFVRRGELLTVLDDGRLLRFSAPTEKGGLRDFTESELPQVSDFIDTCQEIAALRLQYSKVIEKPVITSMAEFKEFFATHGFRGANAARLFDFSDYAAAVRRQADLKEVLNLGGFSLGIQERQSDDDPK